MRAKIRGLRKPGINNVDNAILIILLLLIGNSTILSDKVFILFFACFLIFYATLYRSFKFNIVLFYGTLTWVLMNLFVSIVFDVPYLFFRIFNDYLLIILIPILSIKIIGAGFWSKFEKIAFFLTKLSIPIFLLNVLFPGWFIQLSSIFKPVTRGLLSEFQLNTYYWSALVYVHMDNVSLPGNFRNAGFMWEPGGFAWVIIFLISIGWLRNGVEFSRKFFIYFIALLTTFSTSGYVAMTVLISGALISKKQFKFVFLTLIFLLFSLPYLTQLDFVGQEISEYFASINNEVLTGQSVEFKVDKLNRFQIVKYHLIDVLAYPLGYGAYNYSDIYQLEKVVGVNGITNTLLVWGVPFFILILLLYWKFLMLMNVSRSSVILVVTTFIANLVMIFSNPITFNILFYLTLVTPLLLKKKNGA